MSYCDTSPALREIAHEQRQRFPPVRMVGRAGRRRGGAGHHAKGAYRRTQRLSTTSSAMPKATPAAPAAPAHPVARFPANRAYRRRQQTGFGEGQHPVEPGEPASPHGCRDADPRGRVTKAHRARMRATAGEHRTVPVGRGLVLSRASYRGSQECPRRPALPSARSPPAVSPESGPSPHLLGAPPSRSTLRIVAGDACVGDTPAA